jgi:hypothetical protein
MLPKSDDLEQLYARTKKLVGALRRMRGAELTKQDLKDELAAISRTWLRVSPGIREAGCCKNEVLAQFDAGMTDLLSSATQRARASAVKKKLDPFVDGVVDAVIVPVIQVEGSPRQVAARQIQDAFEGVVSPEEGVYVEEAARCVTVECYRAAIIMLWAAAVARIHGAIVRLGFGAYSKAVDGATSKAGAPFNRVKAGAKITSLPELQRSRDADLLVVGMDLFRYDLQSYQELDRLLGQRNDCAHPGMNRPGALDVQQFASKLRMLVFERVSL